MQLEGVRAGRWLTAGWVQVAFAAWALVLVGVGVKSLASPRSHSCYPIFVGAARHWVQGAPLYSPAGQPSPDLDCYRYSPLIAVLLVPLGMLPDPVGGVLWRLLNATVLLGGLAWWSRPLPSSLARPGQRAALFLLVLPLAIGNLHNGQANALVLGLLLATMAAVAEERWNWAAASMALACLLKVYPLAAGLLLVVVYPCKFGPRLAGFLAVGLVLPFALQEPGFVAEQYQSWLVCLRGDDRSGFPIEYGYRDWQLLGRVLGLPMSMDDYHVIQVMAGAAMAVMCLLGRRAGWDRRRLLFYLLGWACCWMTLFGPATESCTYLLIVPTLGRAMVEAAEGPRRMGRRVWLAGAYALLVVAQAACWFPAGRSVQALGLQPVAALVLLMYLVIEPWRAGARKAIDRVEAAGRGAMAA